MLVLKKSEMDMLKPSDAGACSASTSRVIPSQPSPGPEVYLELRYGPCAPTISEQRLIKLTGDKVTVGRSITHTVILNCLQISRNHCTFILHNGNWYVTDQSTNGIYINENKVPKGERKAIHDGDILHLIPGGILNYRVRVTPAPTPIRPIQTAHREPEIIIDEDTSSSSNSESLLSVGNQEELEDLYVSCEDQIPETTKPVPLLKPEFSPVESRIKGAFSKGISPQKTSTSPKSGWQKRPYNDVNAADKPANSSPKKIRVFGLLEDVDKDSDVEELLDVEEPATTDFSKKLAAATSKFQKSNFQSNDRFNFKYHSPSKGSVQPDDSTKKEKDESVAMIQLRFFQKKCQDLEDTNKLLVLQNKIEMDKLKSELNCAKSKAEAEQEEVYKKVLELMEFEFNCCICNEIYITATVIDCAHTFCSHCITEWSKKKAECPKCRTKITNRTKHVEMENYISRAFSAMSPEIQARREQLIKDRADEIATSRATEEAEAEALRQRGGARNAFQFAQVAHANRLFEFLADMEQLNNPNLGDLMGEMPPFQLPGLSARTRGRGRTAGTTSRRSQRVRRNAGNV